MDVAWFHVVVCIQPLCKLNVSPHELVRIEALFVERLIGAPPIIGVFGLGGRLDVQLQSIQGDELLLALLLDGPLNTLIERLHMCLDEAEFELLVLEDVEHNLEQFCVDGTCLSCLGERVLEHVKEVEPQEQEEESSRITYEFILQEIRPHGGISSTAAQPLHLTAHVYVDLLVEVHHHVLYEVVVGVEFLFVLGAIDGGAEYLQVLWLVTVAEELAVDGHPILLQGLLIDIERTRYLGEAGL